MNHNCKDFINYDPLLNETKLNSCPEDKDLEAKLKKPKDTRDIIDYENIVGAIHDDIDVSQESNNRSLSNIIDRVNLISESLPSNVMDKTTDNLKSVTDVPDTIDYNNNLAEAFDDESYRPHALLNRLVEAGDLGKKSGKGIYDWSSGEKVEREF